jgi:hypothetical protein
LRFELMRRFEEPLYNGLVNHFDALSESKWVPPF